jgi:hypothetical protein
MIEYRFDSLAKPPAALQASYGAASYGAASFGAASFGAASFGSASFGDDEATAAME